MLAGVGQPLLHDPVRGPAQRRRHLPRAGDAVADVHPHPGRPRLGDQGRQVGEGGLRRLGGVAGTVVLGAEHPDHLAQVLEGGVRAAPDHPGGPGHLVGRRVRAELQRTRVQAEQRDPMGQHVVHLPGDPGAFEVAGLGDPQLLLRLGPLGPLPQRHDQLPPGPHEHPPGQHRETEHHSPGHGGPVGHARVRACPTEDQVGDETGTGDRDRDGGPPVHHHGEVEDQQRDGGGHREQRQRCRRHYQPERPSAAHPEQPAADQPDHGVGTGHPVVRERSGHRRVGRQGVGGGEEHPEQGDQERDAVHDPVAGGATRTRTPAVSRHHQLPWQQPGVLRDGEAGHAPMLGSIGARQPATKVEIR
ncbi:hypothetical protein ONO86_02716 [Micromonospora noduli]|nr:hypothetical protein ONO86_02716 [Micromonospora noduli]